MQQQWELNTEIISGNAGILQIYDENNKLKLEVLDLKFMSIKKTSTWSTVWSYFEVAGTGETQQLAIFQQQ